MTQPLMPKATAVWLIENTSLTFEQIANFCKLHILEVKAIADGEISSMTGFDPIASSQLTQEEIRRCEENPQRNLEIREATDIEKMVKMNRAKYIPLSKRKDKPSAILWIVKYYPEISDMQICKFIGTTRLTVQAIRSKTHKNIATLEPHSPVALGFCTQSELEQFLGKNSRG